MSVKNTDKARQRGARSNTPGAKSSSGASLRRTDKPSESVVLGQNIEQQLLSIISGNADEKVVRTRFLQMAQQTLGASAACFLARSRIDTWLPNDRSPRMGRLPQWEQLPEDFSEKCDEFARSTNIQQARIGDLTALLAPVQNSSTEVEIMFVLLRDPSQVADAGRVLQKMAVTLQVWLRSRLSADNEWQVASLGTIIELVGKLESQPNIDSAAEELANLLSNHLKCRSVTVGLTKRERMRLSSISGVAKIDHSSQIGKDSLATLMESALRKQPALFPAMDMDNNHLLQAHRQLASGSQIEAVFSFPLITEDDQAIGAVVLTGDKEQLSSEHVRRFCLAAAPAIANTLHTVNRVQLSRIRRGMRFVSTKLSKLKTLAILLAIVGVVALMFLPITYRVRCNCVTEVMTRRFAVAPFDGLIVRGKVKAGDMVTAGETLAEMDGRTIRWELSGVMSEREQSDLTQKMELKERNVAKSFLADLEYDRLVSEEAILQYKRDHLLIKSPISGVVLAGDIERAEAASVKTGEKLFEIGPIKPMRLEVAIPSEEIAQVRSGFPIKAWIDGQEEEPFEGTIVRIQPRSETRDARNVFIAEVEFLNDDERLRPGMSGTVRIDCEQRSLGWSLFHKPMNYLRSQFAWW